jgi:hypothetical protein
MASGEAWKRRHHQQQRGAAPENPAGKWGKGERKEEGRKEAGGPVEAGCSKVGAEKPFTHDNPKHARPKAKQRGVTGMLFPTKAGVPIKAATSTAEVEIKVATLSRWIRRPRRRNLR